MSGPTLLIFYHEKCHFLLELLSYTYNMMYNGGNYLRKVISVSSYQGIMQLDHLKDQLHVTMSYIMHLQADMAVTSFLLSTHR